MPILRDFRCPRAAVAGDGGVAYWILAGGIEAGCAERRVGLNAWRSGVEEIGMDSECAFAVATSGVTAVNFVEGAVTEHVELKIAAGIEVDGAMAIALIVGVTRGAMVAHSVERDRVVRSDA